MRWGIIVDTNGDGFDPGEYDGEFDLNVSGFLKRKGVETDDYYVAHPDAAVTSTSGAAADDPGGAGTITVIASVPYGGATNIAAGNPFMLVWFVSDASVGELYGVLGNTSGTANFVIPAEGATQPYTGFFAGSTPDPIKPAAYTFGASAPGPEIVVQLLPAGTNLTHGTSTVDYGAVAKGGSVHKQFKIRNVGSADLTVTGANIDGAAAGSYSLTFTGDVIAAGGSMTFSVDFSPATAGAKNAVLHIASTDDNEASFDINLTGSGIATPGVVAIDLPAGSTIDVMENAGSVLIPVIRTGGSDNTLNFTANTTNGTAVLNSDFSAPTNPQSLADGVTSGNVSVPILDPLNTNEGNETFTVSLSGASVNNAGTTSVTVRIFDSADTAAPGAPIVLTPKANEVRGVDTGGTLNITGTATDNKGVAFVKVKLNGGSFVDADLATPGNPGTNWSLDVVPVAGSNTILVQSFDTHGVGSAVVTRTFTVTRPLVVNADSTLGSVTAGFAPSSYRQVGKSYTISATPKGPAGAFKGALFAGWSVSWDANTPTPPAVPTTTQQSAARIGVAVSSLEKQTLTFIFREGLKLTANFVENPYTSLAGVYNGLIRPSATLPAPDGTLPSNATEGFITATVMNTGAFSGKLTIDGLVLGVAGTFDSNGDARFGTSRAFTQTVARTGKPSLVVALHLNTAENLADASVDDKLTGTVTAKAFKQSVVQAVSDVDADRAFYDGKSQLVPGAYLGAANANGVFTAHLPPKDVNDQTPGFTEQDYPQGHGIAIITITKAGGVTVTGTLADGVTFSASSTLSEIGATHASRFPLYSSLYSAKGFLAGFVAMDNTQPSSDLAAADLEWSRPFQPASHYYPYGWPEVIKVDLAGALYAATAGQSVVKAANGANLQTPDDDGNVTLTLSVGQLSEDLQKFANLTGTDTVTKVPDNDPTFTMSVSRASGQITGTFTHTDDTAPAYKAVILQKGPDAGGYGHFLTKQPVPIDYTGESGNVLLIGQP